MYIGMKSDPGRVSFSSVSIKYLIQVAYSINSNAKIDGGPGWIDSEMYDTLATFQTGTSNDRMRLMLRALLAERCKLAVHPETRDQAAYGITIAKGGPKLKSYDPNNLGNGNRGGPGHLELHNATVGQLGNSLYSELGRFVVDTTGLTGTYDIVLDWTPANTPIDDPKANGPSITTAVQEQLGLKLEPQRAPIEYLVIDHVEKPTGN
jgi:uncharacterized protein (TIGR03435 family)